ncbi:diguanylate cyclase (GGDEF)-like protein/PAS domain S-box-containing protein [Pseudomonas sp. GGS8]|uniref:putative bifunctional diguanylate cyclase/phosphodiesterase n=1 Tax=Pseudomonas sp. GGS8 TaxID=2817892 RepID=UPI0020A1B551|nr:EAL domain-containing protein [Pseudomonas sp. GGS8]MCP1446025.1 diguanylate cyclase (GGDEF)-like protein/PAS domain S-box-containing protein [Pseudomonas sp. GGS8]
MIYAFTFHITVNLIVGLALWLVWMRVPRQGFTRLLGINFVAQTFGGVAYFLWHQPEFLVHSVGVALVLSIAVLSQVTMAAGLRELIGRPLSRVQCLGIGLALTPAFLATILGFGLETTQGFFACCNVVLGLSALRWLWNQGRTERLVGVLLVLLGLNQFTYAVGGEALLAQQACVAAGLRLVLGIGLLHAALYRASIESSRLREQLHYLTEHSHQGVAVIRGNHVLYANEALLRIYGVSHTSAFEAFRKEMPPTLREIVDIRHRALLDGSLQYDQWEGERQRSDGTLVRLMFSSWCVSWEGRPAEHLVVSDDTERFNAAKTLLHQATHDPVTGLPNRGALLQRLHELCAGTQPVALVWLDLDRFTQLTEAYGHAIGDNVLRAFAALLRAEFEPQTKITYLGENGFVLLLTQNVDLPALRELTQRLRDRMTRAITIGEQEIYMDASIGVARFPDTAANADSLLREASMAMHEAKQDPGTSVRWAKAGMERNSAIMLTEQAMRAGLNNAEFQLVYQPKVAAHGGALQSFEALARWHRPGYGVISPDDFIPVAERTGLIIPLGALLLEKACRQQSIWLRGGSRAVPVAVNVSPLQLQDPSFPDFVVRTLQTFALPAALLTLEVTETVAVRDAEQAHERITRLKDLGIKVALDDFGTGFSSLNLLRSMPLDAIKIDRSLIEAIPQHTASAVVRAICQLAAALELKVVAEGVETEAQAEGARAAGCHELQGYLFSRPLSPALAAEWLERSAKVIEVDQI